MLNFGDRPNDLQAGVAAGPLEDRLPAAIRDPYQAHIQSGREALQHAL